jgi:tetratricopeptide (TPR) repeat protein
MKRIIIYIIQVFIIGTLQAEVALYEQANSAYESGNYAKADSMYTALLAEQGPSAEVYYNLGNACYKQQLWARAIINYERCLQLNQRMSDAAYNLELAQTHIRDQIEPIKLSLISILWRDICGWLSASSWALIAILFSWLTLCGVVAYLFASSFQLRRWGLLTIFTGVGLSMALLAITLSANSIERNEQYGIIMAPSVILKSEPSESSTNLFILHEGLKMRLIQTDGDWVRVRMPDGNNGWMPIDALEII